MSEQSPPPRTPYPPMPPEPIPGDPDPVLTGLRIANAIIAAVGPKVLR